MKMILKKLCKFCILVTLALSLSGSECNHGATETGNPFGLQVFNQALLIQSAICNKLVQCFPPLLFSDCVSGTNAVTNIDTALGLNDGDFANFQAVIDAEFDRLLDPDEFTADECIGDIQSLSCSSPEVVSAFDVNDPENFDNVFNLLSTDPDSCPAVY